MGRLRTAGCWDESRVREWRDVATEAQRNGVVAHAGRIFDIVAAKNAELPKGHPGRKFKGRVVFGGNQVYDQNWEVAMIQELSSCPATLEAAKVADVYGICPGLGLLQADAEQAYTQSKLGGVPTWVRLPREQRPSSWKT